jgi:hypothetical protein
MPELTGGDINHSQSSLLDDEQQPPSLVQPCALSRIVKARNHDTAIPSGHINGKQLPANHGSDVGSALIRTDGEAGCSD